MEELLKLQFTNSLWMIIVPLILMVLDIITGYYNAWKNGDVSSAKMRDGLGKKCAELCYIAIGFLFKYAFSFPFAAYFLVIYICYMELVSLAENCDKLGIKLPAKINEKVNNKNDENTGA